MTRTITTVGVAGLGIMGAGIVEVFAKGGLTVVGVELNEDAKTRGQKIIERSTQKGVDRGKMTAEDRQTILDRITYAGDFTAFADCDLVIEAIPEKLTIKQDFFRALDDIVKPTTILATNTSSLSVTDIAAATKHPERVIGMHFFNPAPILKLVEVIQTVSTDQDIADTVHQLATTLGKRPVLIGDKAGFIANYLLFGYLNHAVNMLDQGFATREDIDLALTAGAGLPMGPFALLDLIGLDTSRDICETLYNQTTYRTHATSPLLDQLASAGHLGRKTGRGFYTYAEVGRGTVIDDQHTPAEHTTPNSLTTIGIHSAHPHAETLHALADKAGLTATISDTWQDLSTNNIVLIAGTDEQLTELTPAADQACPADVLIAIHGANTNLTAAAAKLNHPERVVGLHTTSKDNEIALLEIAPALQTTPEALANTKALGTTLGVATVVCGDRAGRIRDGLLFPYLNDAIDMVDRAYATCDDVDTAMKFGCGYPAGPFDMIDSLGLDVVLTGQRAIFGQTKEAGYRVSPLLEQKVTAGHLGAASGEGFRRHN